jgi:hypothetical protein
MAPGGDLPARGTSGRWLVKTEDSRYVLDLERMTVLSFTGRLLESVNEPLVEVTQPRLGEPLRLRLRDCNGAEREVATTSVQEVRRLITQAEVDSGRHRTAC